MKKPGILTVKVNEVNGVDSTISDKDLVELAGYEALCDVSQKVTFNMEMLGEQVDRGTMN
ncbi:hypothetical protein RFW18_21635 [Metabacillus idriensis]|uniref:hypothetical protein n=1 Tax=Metabacillus idriensis TaxID=324768 RepID=UPI0028131E95|nr:hypothetical protein [Metabacillus idriensis]MDR0140345.1 hypothetical protein [Metabacillus idriensis]